VKEKIQDSTDKRKEKRKETRSAIQQFNSLGERGKLRLTILLIPANTTTLIGPSRFYVNFTPTFV
jgi:hypothetical protein